MEFLDLETRNATVKEIAIDMSKTMNLIVSNLFHSAIRTYDRFHIMKNVLDDLQAIRTRIKTKYKDEDFERRNQCKID
ncbi:MAG: transposase [Patescibacteria group bacterium]|nr:transposase [Patescibacteria group bacterium]